jgi:curved DNA-binding protein
MPPRVRTDRDYYGLLGVGADAGEEEIRRAFRRLALTWHPDRNPGKPEAAERFKEISEAYAVLIDPAKRREYDTARRIGAPGGWEPSREDIFRDLFDDPRASAIFEEITRELERMGMRVTRRDFRDTLFGGRTVVTGTVVVVSPVTAALGALRLVRAALRGARRASDPAPKPQLPRPGVLSALGRAGRWLLGSSSSASNDADVVVALPVERAEAAQGGRKRVLLPGREDVLVTIPAGVRTGTRLRLRGKGKSRADGRRGDAYLVIEVREA